MLGAKFVLYRRSVLLIRSSSHSGQRRTPTASALSFPALKRPSQNVSAVSAHEGRAWMKWVAQACGFACAFRKIRDTHDGLAQTAQNGIQQGKQRRQQGDRSGLVVRQDMQGEFAFPKAVKP